MSAYNPPLFNNSVIQFNPTIYETGTTSTASQSLTLLKTDNIQCLLPNDPVTLYTVGSGQVTLGTGGNGVQVVGTLSANFANFAGMATSDIAVQTGQTSISIGTSATTVLIRPTTTQISGNLQANNIDKYTSGPISLYQTAVGSVTLGNNATNVDIQAIRIATASIYPSSSQTLYIGNSNAPTIELGATSCSTLNIGSVNSTSYFKNAISAIFGVNPNTYLPAGTLTDCGMRLYNSGTASSFDLYSAGSSISAALPSSRFISTGGSALINTAALQIQSGTISIEPVGNLTLGSSTTTTTYVKTSDVTVIGANPTSYSVNKLIGLGLVITTAGSGINFYSNNSAVSSGYSGRIYSDSGTASSNSGTLHIDSGNINLYAPLGDITVGSAGTTNANMNATTVNIGQGNTSTINIGTNTATTGITIGNSSIVNTFIKNTTQLVVGTDPTTFVTATALMTGQGMRFLNNGVNSIIDFYSSTLGGQQNPTARFQVSGGTTANTGSFTLNAGNLNFSGLYNSFTGAVICQSGLAYGKGNLTSPSFTQTGGFGNGATTVAANSVVNYSATWAAMGLANFGTAPTVICCNGCSSGLGQKLIMSCYGATTTQVSFSLYNPSATTTGSVAISIQFIATGGY